MRKMPNSFNSQRISIFLAVFILLSDQLSKLIVVRNIFFGDSLNVLPFFNIIRVENRGITFGMLSGFVSPLILTMISCLVVIVLLIWIKKAPPYYKLPTALIISGAIGNIIDRISRGAVVDFLDIHIYGYHWPAFNIADSAIVIGTLIALIISYGEKS